MELLFELGNESVIVVINGNDIKFGSTNFGAQLADISGLQLSKVGCIKQFPDLKDRDDWKDETVKRFKDKIKSMKTEDEKGDYIIKELLKQGYNAKIKRRKGFRPEKIR